MNLDVTQASFFTIAAGVVALFLWWLERKNREIEVFPILALLEPHQAQKSKLRFNPPPWLAYFFVLGIVSILSFYALKPFQTKSVAVPSSSSESFLLVVDQSPSLAAFVNEPEYKARISTLVKDLKTQGKSVHIFFNDFKITQVAKNTTDSDLDRILGDMPFFAPDPLQLVEVWPTLARTANFENSQILIVSDRDSFFWSGFSEINQKETKLYWLKPYDNKETGSNIYIESALFKQSRLVKGTHRPVVAKVSRALLARPNNDKAEWEVTLRQNGQQFGLANVSFDAVTESAHIEINPTPGFKYSEKSELVLKPTSSSADDILTLDNTYSLKPASDSLRIRVVSETLSESLLKSALYAFGESWSSLNQSVKYSTFSDYNTATAPVEDLTVLVETQNNFSAYCRKAASQSNSARVWVVPNDLTQEFKNLCDCASFFLEPESPQNFRTKFCSEPLSTADFTSTLVSLGATVFGGQVDEAETSGLSYEFKLKNSIMQKETDTMDRLVRFWKIPLDPNPALSHVKIFRLIQTFAEEWKKGSSLGLVDHAETKNIPLSESKFALSEEEALPTKLNFKIENSYVNAKLGLADRLVEIKNYDFLSVVSILAALWMILEAAALLLHHRKNWFHKAA